MTEFKDAFGRTINIGDEIATIADGGKNVLRGITIRLGKGNVAIRVLQASRPWLQTEASIKQVPYFRAIKTGYNEIN